MTLYSMIVLGLFVIMWVLCSYEIGSKNKLIRKLNTENEEVTADYNQLVSDYNDICDFLEKHFSKEELDELLFKHDVDKLMKDGGNVNPEMRKHIENMLREDYEPR